MVRGTVLLWCHIAAIALETPGNLGALVAEGPYLPLMPDGRRRGVSSKQISRCGFDFKLILQDAVCVPWLGFQDMQDQAYGFS